MSSDSKTLVIAAPGEEPDDRKNGAPAGYYNSKGNIYFTTVATSSSKADPNACTYNPLAALEKPPVANGKAQGFGLSITSTPDASILLAGIAGCFVPPGGSPPPCPDFPGGAPGVPPAQGNLTSGNFQLVKRPAYWPPAFLNKTGVTPPGVVDPADPNVVPVQMDLLWLYTRLGGLQSQNSNDVASQTHSWPPAPVSYALDRQASAQLKISGYVLTNQTDTFYYRTPAEIFATVSAQGNTIAVVALISDVSKEQGIDLTGSTGVQVFKRSRAGWSKVLNMQTSTETGQPCSTNITVECFQSYARNAAISPDGRTLATLWGTGWTSPMPLSLHVWTGSQFVFAKWLNFSQKDSPLATPAFSPDSRYMGLTGMLYNEAAGKFQAYIQIYSLTTQPRKHGGRTSQLTQLVCNMTIPGDINPFSTSGSITGLSLLYVSEGKGAVLRLAASQAGNPTLIYDMPLLRTKTQSTIACPDPRKPTYSILPNPAAFGEPARTAWGSMGSQAVSATKVLGGQPGSSATGVLASGGASVIAL